MSLPRGDQLGFLAQELELVFPDMVRNVKHPVGLTTDSKETPRFINYKGVNYTALIPVLVKGMQEQQEIIESLEARIPVLVKGMQSRQALDGLERGEVSGTITLERLRRLAEALHSRVDYMIVPDTSLAEMRRSRATKLAETQLKRVSHSMKLEAQDVKQQEAKRQLKRLVDEILSENPRKLWD